MNEINNPAFDVRHILAPAAVGLVTVGEAVQTEHQETLARGQEPVDISGIIGQVYETVATMPLDAKALGVGVGFVTAKHLVHEARRIQNSTPEAQARAAFDKENGGGDSLPKRAAKQTASLAISAAGGVAAYKVGEKLSAEADLYATLGLMGAGVAYLTRAASRAARQAGALFSNDRSGTPSSRRSQRRHTADHPKAA